MVVGQDIFLCAHQLYLLCWETVLDEAKMCFYVFYILGSNQSQVGLIVQWVYTKALPWHCKGQSSSQVEG